MKSSAKTFEVHTHSFIRGKRAGGYSTGKFSHSHEGGNVAHAHPDTGPAAFTIDKDDWFRSTGLRGGGRKKFTAKPSGEQLAIEELEDWQKSFELIICAPTPSEWGTGTGEALPLRLMRTFKMDCIVKDGTS